MAMPLGMICGGMGAIFTVGSSSFTPSHPRQLYLGRTWRTAWVLVGMKSTFSLTSSPIRVKEELQGHVFSSSDRS